jgi:recombinational DNA repair protein (RecF pathway)
LCLRTLGEDDPQPAVFAGYDAAMQQLAGLSAEQDSQAILRQFEVRLLAALGLWPDSRSDSAGEPLQPALHYTLDDATGWREVAPSVGDWCLQGATIVGLSQSIPVVPASSDKLSLRVAMRALLARALDGKVLSTREVWKQLDAISAHH